MTNYDEKATKNVARVTGAGTERPAVNPTVKRVPSGATSKVDVAPQPTSKKEVVNVNIDPVVEPIIEPPKKKKGGKGIILVILLIIIAIIVVIALASKGKGNGDTDASTDGTELATPSTTYEETGRYAYDKLQNALISYDAEVLDSIIGVNPGDSYLAQEWAFVNGVQLRQEFISKICSQVTFTYPNDDMLNNESVTVSVPDWFVMQSTMQEEADYIRRLYEASGYKPTDYDYEERMFNLFCQYIVDRSSMSMKSVDVNIPLVKTLDGTLMIESDADLDTMLFATDDFHDALKVFSQICKGWTGLKDEYYTVEEEHHNPEYDEWYEIFIEYYDADNGKYNKYKSKWEPWYLRDENNNYVLDENGEKVVNYYSVKMEDGTDWIQPAETVLVDVEYVRQIEDPWIEEWGIPYCMLGTYYIQNDYTGKYTTAVRVGDGTIDAPAGIGTEIITKVLCSDGRYHDVKVALLGYWVHQDAIDYAERFSAKNKGFTVTSPVKLICYELSVENLESVPITFESEMALCDRNGNISARTGSMYGFTSTATLKAGEKVILNDWATSTELEQKYVCWGKTFGRDIQTIFFNVLAGTGDIPTYSAYKQFTGESLMED